MKTDVDVIIIGAGPAGLMAGVNISGCKTLILEKNSSAGKKLLISGAGQCNFTHAGDISDFYSKYGAAGTFLKPALMSFKNNDVLKFFEGNGLECFVREDGKVFPKSLKAADVLKVLLNKCKSNGVEIAYNSQVTDISYNQDLGFFTVKLSDKKYTTENLLITTGGKSYENTGSTGDGYRFATNLGHNIVATKPCLVPVNTFDYPFADIAGTSFENILISLYRGNKKIYATRGDVLLTHKNISGPGVLNFSRYIEPGDVVRLNFVGVLNEELGKHIDNFGKTNGKSLVKTALKDYPVSKAFVDKILDLSEIPQDLPINQLAKKQKLALINNLTDFNYPVKDFAGYHLAMATSGGVDLKEINRKTMESKLVKGLYFAGEVMDIDGDTGGYNIQAAFSTAVLAAKAMSLKDKGNCVRE